MPFLAVAPRLAVRAVKGAPFAFTGAKRKPLTEEAHGLGAGFCQEGKRREEKGREGKRREDREANDDVAKQQKRPRLCAGAESRLQVRTEPRRTRSLALWEELAVPARCDRACAPHRREWTMM